MAVTKLPGTPDDAPAFTHYVHLADGRVVQHTESPLFPYFEEDDGNGNITRTQIIGVYPR